MNYFFNKTKPFVFYLAIILVSTACNNSEDELEKDISVPVSVMEIKPAGIKKYIEVTGNVMPQKKAELKTQVAGHYQLQINSSNGKPYTLGNFVEKNKTIIRLEDREYENNIKMESLELNLEVSEQTFNKQKSLYDKGGVTLSDLKAAEIEYINARYNVEDAKIRRAKLNVMAPFSGILVYLPYFTPGVRVEAGTHTATLMDYNQLIMEVEFPEKNMKEISIGQEVIITNYTLPNDTLEAIVTQLSPAINPQTRSFSGLISIKNPDRVMRPGMFAKAEIVVSKQENAIVLPKDIILAKQRGKTVFVVGKGLAIERVIETGLENPTEVQVISGVKEGDKVIIKGFETLRNRAKIKVVK